MSLVPASSGAFTAGSVFHHDFLNRGNAPRSADAPIESDPLGRLERAVAVALSPFDYGDATAWADALTAALCTVAGADAGFVLLSGTSLPWRTVSTGANADATGPGSSSPLHDEITEQLRTGASGDLVLWARDDLADTAVQPTTITPRHTVGIRVRTDRGAVAAVCMERHPDLGPAPHYLLASLRAIAPAFRAGVNTWVGATAAQTNIAQMLDSLTDAALLFDAAGTLVHANAAADRLTSAADTARLRRETQRIAWALGAIAHRRATASRGPAVRSHDASQSATPTTQSVRVGATVYQLRGTMVGEQLTGAKPAVLITITVAAAKPLTDDELQAEYGLTARETQVARLIDEGLSNNEIADRLGVRFFTARNHVERTLAKLGVPSRNRVGPLLRTGAEPCDSNRATAA